MWLAFLIWLHFSVAAHVNAKPTTSQSLVPAPTPSTIIDFLSADAQYSYFLRHLQRHGLVPTINKMQNVTLLAPVNLAFVDEDLAEHDNKENLLRYFAAQRFRIGYMDRREAIFDSLYVTKRSASHNRTFPLKILSFPRQGSSLEFYVNDVAEIVDFDGYVKHQHSFIQTIDRLIPVSPSICDVLMDSSNFTINGQSVSFIKQLFQLVFTPFHKKEKTKLCESFLANVSTIFIPSDRFVAQSMLPLQLQYYSSLFVALSDNSAKPTKDAIREIKADSLSMLLHLLLSDLVGGVNGTSGHKLHKTPSHNNKYNITLVNETSLCINGEITSSGELSSLPASDGLLYIFDTDEQAKNRNFFLLLKIPLADMIPRKALFALRFSRFVKELKFRKLGYLINGSMTNQTIVLDASDRDDLRDDDAAMFDIQNDEEEDEVQALDNYLEAHEDMSTSSFSNKQSMLYRFLEGAVDLRRELNSSSSTYQRLLTSNLCLKKRIGSCYKVKVTATREKNDISLLFNDDLPVSLDPSYASGDNIIYIADLDFLAPSSFKHTIAELISSDVSKRHLSHINIDKQECLKTLGYLNTFKLSLLPDNKHGYTVFLPCGNTIWEDGDDSSEQDFGSWEGLGLILNYLEANPKVMKKVLMGLFLKDLIYSDFGLEDDFELQRMVPTLTGEPINVTESYRSGDYNHLIRLNNTAISVPLNSDVLFNQGVIHITSRLFLPDNFYVPLTDLILATEDALYEDNSFIQLLEKFPKLSNALGIDGSGHSSDYSLLVPSPEQLKAFNITSDYARLWEFLELHLIPKSQVSTLLACINSGHSSFGQGYNQTFTIRTNRTDGIFQCRRNKVSGKTYLQLQNSISTAGYNADHQVRIVSHGCDHVNLRNGTCVFLIDKPLSLGWFDLPDNFLHVHIGWISVGIGIIIGVILFGFLITTLVVCLSSDTRKKPPLLSAESIFAPTESTYMRVTSDEDINGGYYDYGYETDDDMMRNERDQLLGPKRKKKYNTYNATSLPIGAPSAPRYIKKGGIGSTLNRDRNLPLLNL